MIYNAVLLRHGNYRLPTELYVLDVEAGPAEESSMIAPVPRLGQSIGNHGEIEAIFDVRAIANLVTMAIRIPAGTEIDPGNFALRVRREISVQSRR